MGKRPKRARLAVAIDTTRRDCHQNDKLAIK
jgi:hypothetical protein